MKYRYKNGDICLFPRPKIAQYSESWRILKNPKISLEFFENFQSEKHTITRMGSCRCVSMWSQAIEHSFSQFPIYSFL